MKTVAIILLQSGRYRFIGQEDRARQRDAGLVVADASFESAQSLVLSGHAAFYYPGQKRRAVEHLDPLHPLSNNQIYLRRKAEKTFLLQCAMHAQANHLTNS